MGIAYLDLNHKEKFVSIQDSAIDKSKTDLVKFRDERKMENLIFLDGIHPTYFILTPVDSIDSIKIQQDHLKTEVNKDTKGMTPEELKKNGVTVKQINNGEMIMKYFLAGCKSVEENGVVTVVDEDFMRQIPSVIIQEVGAHIMLSSILPDSKKK